MSGDPDAVLVQVLLAHQPVLADRQAVVSAIDDDGVPGQAIALQRLQNAPDFGVKVRDHAVVVGDVLAHFGLIARLRGQQLVAEFR